MSKDERTEQQKQFDMKLGQKLKEIRERHTDDNQEDFYEKYVRELHVANRNTRSSTQRYISDIENGVTTCPLQLLPVYARIAHCSIDDLFDTTEVVTDNPAELYPEAVCRFITNLFGSKRFGAEIIDVNNPNNAKKNGLAILFFSDDEHALDIGQQLIIEFLKAMQSVFNNDFLSSEQLQFLSEHTINTMILRLVYKFEKLGILKQDHD